MTTARLSSEGIIATIEATALPLGHTDYSGIPGAPLVEVGNESDSATFHLLAGVGATAPYLLGLGVDHDNSPTGIVASVKGNNSIGMAPTLETTSGSGSKGFLGQNLSSGQLMVLTAGSTATGPLLVLNNTYGGTGDLIDWNTTGTSGKIGSAGNITMTGAGAGVTLQHAATNQNQLKVSTNSGANALNFYHWSGSANLWFPSAISTNGQTLAFKSGGAAAIGSESLSTIIAISNGNSLGFYGKTPTTQQVLATGAAHTVDDVITALQTLGLVKQA